MNIRTLRYLIALADTRHFGRAAERCFVSQPTLSAQLKKLEEELGVTLIERRHKSFLLTGIGEEVVARARRLLREADEIVDVARFHQDPLRGRLAIGFIPTVGPYLLPHAVGRLNASLPELQFYFAEYQTATLLERLAAGDIDVAILALPLPDGQADNVQERVLYDERFVAALPATHGLARRKRLRPAELDSAALLLLEDGHCLRDQALAICPADASASQTEMAATSLETLRQMVAAGQGVTLLPELAAVAGSGASAALAIRRFVRPEPVRRIGAVWRQSSARAMAITAVCDELEATAKSVLAKR